MESPRPVTPGRWLKVAKMAVPHLLLYLFILCYLVGGAWLFARLEADADRERQRAKLEEVRRVYAEIAGVVREECGSGDETELYSVLAVLSSHMEGRPFPLTPHPHQAMEELLPPRWDGMSSLLFALSILTTTGYAHANPGTALGQAVAIVYGLIGIPIMVLAAVDLGRFLSEVVLSVYSRLTRWRRRWLPSRVFRKGEPMPEETEPLAHSDTSAGPTAPQRRLPLSVNAACLLLFCTLGGFVYVAAGARQKQFIEGFFVTFNLVANLTMSEMPNDLSHLLTLLYIAFFVIFGLAVLSMCADLAASELRWVFLKIHYFGRKINWKRKQAKQAQMEVEVKELLKIIEQIRARYPHKVQITPVDILDYMQEMNGAVEDEYFTTQHRRDTIAFMPQSIEALKYADDNDFDEASHRSVQLPIPYLDSETTSLLSTI